MIKYILFLATPIRYAISDSERNVNDTSKSVQVDSSSCIYRNVGNLISITIFLSHALSRLHCVFSFVDLIGATWIPLAIFSFIMILNFHCCFCGTFSSQFKLWFAYYYCCVMNIETDYFFFISEKNKTFAFYTKWVFNRLEVTFTKLAKVQVMKTMFIL